jgi:hypothetical protein
MLVKGEASEGSAITIDATDDNKLKYKVLVKLSDQLGTSKTVDLPCDCNGNNKESLHEPALKRLSVIASEPDRPDRGTGSGNEDRRANEQGSIRGIHLWYAKLDRGSRSTLIWVNDPEYNAEIAICTFYF